MFCFIHGDYFELYKPHKFDEMLGGQIGPLGNVIQSKLLGTSIMMTVPSIMAAFAILSAPVLCKWLNIIVAAFFVGITLLVIQGAWAFYVYFGIVEILLLFASIWFAWQWPRADVQPSGRSTPVRVLRSKVPSVRHPRLQATWFRGGSPQPEALWPAPHHLSRAPLLTPCRSASHNRKTCQNLYGCSPMIP
jgi:hypothetical protein